MDENTINSRGEFAPSVKRNLPRDVFLHLLAMVALYWSAISFITLCWQYVNYFFPDVLNAYGYYGLAGPIRFAVSSLIIMFPVFILTSWFLAKIYAKESQVRESKIRKWLIYLTLFIAALVIIGDLIFVINNLLGGETTARFILKALSIIIVAGVVFAYYLDDVRKSTASKLGIYLAWVSGVAILIGIIGAFFIVGSPQGARQMALDQQRVSDLQGIQYQVVNYWQSKGVLPTALADLHDSISGYTAPVDPDTKQPYEYTLKDANNLTFEVCANFNLPSNATDQKTMPAYPAGDFTQNWDHAAGHVCFERVIDPQLYPPIHK